MSKWAQNIPAQGGEYEEYKKNSNSYTRCYYQFNIHHADQRPDYFLDENVGGEEEGDPNGDYESHVRPAGLGGGGHEGLVVDAHEEADGEEGE